MKTYFPARRFSRRPPIHLIAIGLLCTACASSGRNARIEAAAKPHSVTISWAPGPAGRVAGYNVLRDTLPGPVGVRLNEKPITEARFQDTTVESGLTYTYYVTAVDAKGHESGPSDRAVVQVPSPESTSFATKLFHLFRPRT
jgi:hypothetical protein